MLEGKLGAKRMTGIEIFTSEGTKSLAVTFKLDSGSGAACTVKQGDLIAICEEVVSAGAEASPPMVPLSDGKFDYFMVVLL